MLLEELEPLPGYLQYRHESKVIIKIIDIVPYIDVLRYILPLFQLSGEMFRLIESYITDNFGEKGKFRFAYP